MIQKIILIIINLIFGSLVFRKHLLNKSPFFSIIQSIFLPKSGFPKKFNSIDKKNLIDNLVCTPSLIDYIENGNYKQSITIFDYSFINR